MRPDELPAIAEKRKLYVVVRADLAPGLRAAQAAHAVADICIHSVDAVNWRKDPEGNYLIILEVPDEQALLEFRDVVEEWGVRNVVFREPDLDMQATAFSALPRPELNHLFSRLPLAYGKPWWRKVFGR